MGSWRAGRAVLGLALAVAVLGLAALPARGVSWGQRAPGFTLVDVSGQPTTLGDLLRRHQAVVLALGTTWSYQFPKWAQKLQGLAGRYKDGRLAVAAVFLKDKPQQVRLFVRRHGLASSDMLMLVDANGSLIQPYGLYEIPRLLLLDQAGTIHYDGAVDRIDESVALLLNGQAVPAPSGQPTFTSPPEGD